MWWRRVFRVLAALLSAPLLAVSFAVLLLTDLLWLIFGRRKLAPETMPSTRAASVVIPNWNGRDLMEKFLPSVVEAMAGNPFNEIIVVDNASVDGSADFLREHFPGVRVVAMVENAGFGGGSNAGIRAARNEIVVLLNNDMRVDRGFLQPLLHGFTDAQVFAVSCQIFLGDATKRREETGLTLGWWSEGQLRVSHREDAKVDRPYPCFYGGGGSCAFDRAKFLELGGFDELLAPFYLEDTDLGFLAWKRGWKVLYQPASIVFHEHRGTIGKKFSNAQIQAVLKKNFLLFCWKNTHEWPRLASHFWYTWIGLTLAAMAGDSPTRPNVLGAWRAFTQSLEAAGSRWRARSLAAVSDTEAFARCRGAHFRDRFGPPVEIEGRLRVLFVSPYPILPPVHGGGVFMHETLKVLSQLCETHVLVLLDEASQAPANEALGAFCASVETLVRPPHHGAPTIRPHAVDEFASDEVRWRIDRIVHRENIDVVQIEYTPMGQYIESYERLGAVLFEHDVYFQSVARAASNMATPIDKARAKFEYLRALRYELQLLKACDEVQVCTEANKQCLVEFAPGLEPLLRPGLRACIGVDEYAFPGGPREPFTILFVGSYRHLPNRVAMEWFERNVFPRVIAECPQARVTVVGFTPEQGLNHPAMDRVGYVADVRPLLAQYAAFICPVLTGSGVRVKLIEAFSSGIPVVSTTIGAEGLANKDQEICFIADDPGSFADKLLSLLNNPDEAEAMAARARNEMEQNWNSTVVTRRLVESYRDVLRRKARLP